MFQVQVTLYMNTVSLYYSHSTLLTPHSSMIIPFSVALELSVIFTRTVSPI